VLAWDQSQAIHVELLANELVKKNFILSHSQLVIISPILPTPLCDTQQPSPLPQPHSIVRYTFDSALNKENLGTQKDTSNVLQPYFIKHSLQIKST